MTSQQPEPHIRWRLRESLDDLALSYDSAASAIDAFIRSAYAFDPTTPRPGAVARFRTATCRGVARHGWSRILWFAATLLLASWFLGWISVGILRRFIPGPIPSGLAVAPGVLLTLAVAGTAALLVSTPLSDAARRPQEPSFSWPPPDGPVPGSWRICLLAVVLAGCAAWITTWLVGVAGIPVWFAVTAAALSAAVMAAAFAAAGRPAMSKASTGAARGPGPARPPRRLLARQQAAQQRLRGHARQWSSVAHACGLTLGGSAEGESALNRLLNTGELGDMPAEGLNTFHTQMLVTLLRYQPSPLMAQLRTASQRLLPDEIQPLPATDRNTR